MSECKNCGRPDCPTFQHVIRDSRSYRLLHGADWLDYSRARSAAEQDCREHVLDWRTRALEAEAKLTEADFLDDHAVVRCRTVHYQACHVCTNFDCGDNTTRIGQARKRKAKGIENV